MMIPTEVTTLNIQAAASTVAFLFALLPGAIVTLVFFFFFVFDCKISNKHSPDKILQQILIKTKQNYLKQKKFPNEDQIGSRGIV